MSAVLSFPDMQASFDLEAAIAKVLAADLHGARERQAYGDELHRAVESSRILDRMAARHDYYPVMLSLAADARKNVDDVFDQRPRQSARIAEQTMRSV